MKSIATLLRSAAQFKLGDELRQAAGSIGKLPGQTPEPTPAYAHLVAALDQLGRLGDVRFD